MTNFEKQPSHQAGFSLVELMVGLVIGLFAALVIMQTFSAFEGQKRSTSGTADTQTNGSIGLASIQKVVQAAGFGLPVPNTDLEDNALRCTAANYVDTTDGSTINVFPVVSITDGNGANNSDTLTVRASTIARSGGIPTEIVNASTAPVISVQTDLGCSNGDYAFIINGTNCSISQIQNANPADSKSLTLTAIPAGGVLAQGAKFACMGNWQEYTFAINANNELTLNNNPIVSEVVNMQVQYGVSDAAQNNDVTNWVDAAPASIWFAPNTATRNRIKAIRIALVLRNNLKEKVDVTAAAPITWSPLNGSAAPVVNLGGIPDWQKYRYRTFETIIPIRNILWSSGAV